jgi:hypothetical protein
MARYAPIAVRLSARNPAGDAESHAHASFTRAVPLLCVQEVRGEAWKYLLNVAKPDKSEEMSLRKRMLQAACARVCARGSASARIFARACIAVSGIGDG